MKDTYWQNFPVKSSWNPMSLSSEYWETLNSSTNHTFGPEDCIVVRLFSPIIRGLLLLFGE
jgi:hypothetical protein